MTTTKTNSKLYAVATVGAPQGSRDSRGKQLMERVASRTGEGYAVMDVAGPDKKWTIRLIVNAEDDRPVWSLYVISKGWREADALDQDSWTEIASGEVVDYINAA